MEATGASALKTATVVSSRRLARSWMHSKDQVFLRDWHMSVLVDRAFTVLGVLAEESKVLPEDSERDGRRVQRRELRHDRLERAHSRIRAHRATGQRPS